MKKGKAKLNGVDYTLRTAEDSMYPNIDSTYSTREYYGDRLVVHTTPITYGIKGWSSMAQNKQGMAIYNNLLVRMANVSVSTSHNIYTINANGGLADAATFTLSTTGHSNAMQFAPVVESGNAYPYLYVSDLTGSCEVLNIAANYEVTQVQKITVPSGWQVQIGDDGYIWAISGGGNALKFIKYRQVSVSEGDVTLTANDIIETISVSEKFDTNAYTFQGSKFKYGKAWLPIGTTGDTQQRALFVYDLASKRTAARIDLTSLGNVEFEDCDFWDNALILSCYSSASYILRF